MVPPENAIFGEKKGGEKKHQTKTSSRFMWVPKSSTFRKWVFPKNRDGPPKWMVKIMGKPYFLMDDLGGKTPYFWKPPEMLRILTPQNPPIDPLIHPKGRSE